MFSRCLLVLALAARPACGQAAATDEFITLTAKGDTFAVERYVRTPERVAGEMLVPSVHQLLSYTYTLGDSELVKRLDVAVRPDSAAPSTPARQVFALSFASDSVHIEAPGGTRSVPAARGSLPWINPSFVLLEQLVRRARSRDPRRARTDTVPMFDLNSGPISASVSWVGADSAIIAFTTVTVRAAVDPKTGQVLGVRFPDGGSVRAHHL